jgi:hypothetical protein
MLSSLVSREPPLPTQVFILCDPCVLTAGLAEDPFPDPPGLEVPAEPPSQPPDANSDMVRIAEDEDPLITLPEEEAEEQRRKREAAAAALTLEMVGDLPFANVRPPENVLFVCKLNPVTTDDALELLFSRFGKIMSCQVIRDKRTGDSLQYAFIEFDKREDAEQVCCLYFQMKSHYSEFIGILQNAERPNRRPSHLGGFVGHRPPNGFLT